MSDGNGPGGKVAARLAELGLTLHGPHPPHDPLDAVVVHNGTARTSGQLPRIEGKLTCLGRLGDTVTVEEGREAAAVCALNALAVLEAALGVSRISVGGAFAMAAYGALVTAATELREQGTYGYWELTKTGGRAVRAAFNP